MIKYNFKYDTRIVHRRRETERQRARARERERERERQSFGNEPSVVGTTREQLSHPNPNPNHQWCLLCQTPRAAHAQKKRTMASTAPRVFLTVLVKLTKIG